VLYREALGAVPGGLHSLHVTQERFEKKKNPVCLHCERDELIGIVVACNQKLSELESRMSDSSGPPPKRVSFL